MLYLIFYQFIDYVCVIDVGNLEVNLRTNTEVTETDRKESSLVSGRLASEAGNSHISGGVQDMRKSRKVSHYKDQF